MSFTLSTAGCTGNAKNSLYPNKCIVTNADELKAAVSLDHVCGEFQNNHRSVGEFLSADCLVLDNDNNFSDNPNEQITLQKIGELFPDVSYAIVTSRHHMKTKGRKSARPRFHVYFPHKPITDAKLYSDLKKRIYEYADFFDGNALDAARFIYGNPNAEVEWNEGIFLIDDYLDLQDEDGSRLQDAFAALDDKSQVISEGSRNSTMSLFAGRVIKRFGVTDKAHELFLERAGKCDPPLSDDELQTIWNSAAKFGAKVMASPDYIPPDKFGNSLKPTDYSDIGQAKVLSAEYANELVYTDSTDFMRYDGTRWVESRQLAVGAAEEFLDLQLEDAQNAVDRAEKALEQFGISEEVINAGGKPLVKAIDDKSADAYAAFCAAVTYKNFVMKRRDMKYIVSVLQAAKPMLLHDIKDFDTQEFLLNTPIGTFDLRKGSDGLQDQSAEDLITKITAVSPSDENSDLWQSAIEEFFCGDSELIDYVQQIVGLAAIGKVYVEALIISYGQGKNGKSTFWNTISRVMGTYSGHISADALTVGCKRNVKPEMAELKGKRLVIAAELEEGMRLNTSVVKQLCSTDEVGAEKKYKDPFKYTPTHTLVLYTNHLPKVGATDEGTWRRLIVIPFNAKISGKADIKNYSDYLFNKAGGAVLKWIIEGAKKVIEGNFNLTLPLCVENAISAYRSSNDWLAHFLDDCCEIDSSYTQKSGELYEEYRAFCQRTGEYARSTSDFYSALELAGFSKRKTMKGIFVYGLKVKSEFDEIM